MPVFSSHSIANETYLEIYATDGRAVIVRLAERDPFPEPFFRDQVSFEVRRGEELLDLGLFDLVALRGKGVKLMLPPEEDGSIVLTIPASWHTLWRQRELRIAPEQVRRATSWAYFRLRGEPEPAATLNARKSRPSALAG